MLSQNQECNLNRVTAQNNYLGMLFISFKVIILLQFNLLTFQYIKNVFPSKDTQYPLLE